MSRDSINLFKKRFLDYNRVRYADDDNWRIALESLNVDDIRVLKYMPDPESKFRTVLTEVQSDKFNLSGLDQKYTKAYFGTDVISLLSDKTIYPDLVSVLNLNTMGVFFYKNNEEPEFPHVIVATNFVRRWNDGLPFINEVLKTINTYTHWDIKFNECTFNKNEEDSSGDREVIDVDIDNHTIWGSIKVGQIPAAYPLGTFPYEYFGKFNEFHLIGKESLLTLADIPDSVMDEKHRPSTPLIWLKFRYFGRILYVPKYPILTDVSWDILNSKNMCGGKKIITALDGNEYRIRLLCISDKQNENEWDNLITRCIDGAELMEWEAFNYGREMQYSYSDGTIRHYSSVLTEGYDSSEPHYLVGGEGDYKKKVSVAKDKPSVGGAASDGSGVPILMHGGWLPVLELRGCDPIDGDTIHPHWMDLKDPIPEMNYADVEPGPDMVFTVRLKKFDCIGINDTDLDFDFTSDENLKTIAIKSVEIVSDVPEPSIIDFGKSSASVVGITLLTVSQVDASDISPDLEIVPVSDALYIDYKKVTVIWAAIDEPFITPPSISSTDAQFVRLTRVTESKTISEPYIK